MPGKSLMARSSVAATEHPLASLAAYRATLEGGNAFDAAAAASFALTVLQPHLNSIGGDFFALFYSAKEDRVRCLNSSGWSPSSYSSGAFGPAGVPRFGQGSVVVPGYLRGVHELQRRFGALEFSRSLDGAISLAEDGFPIGAGLVRALASHRDVLPESAVKKFIPSGRVPAPGSRLVQKELGACLREVAEGGPDAFYGGSGARAIIEEMASGGVQVSESDFTDFRPEWCEPLVAEYGGAAVYEVPPNSMGATTLLILKLLEEARAGRHGAGSAERVRETVEAARLAYRARDEELGDPRFVGFDLGRFLGSSRSSAPQRRIDEADTTYFAVCDEEGNMLSCIQSIFYAFGSRVYVDRCGFFLNNRGSSFRMEGPNRVEPRKRPLHTLSAVVMAREGRPFAAHGCSGGEYRPQQHALFVTNMLDYSMDLERAIDHPRFLWDGDAVRIEDGYTGLDSLRMKREMLPYPGPTGVAQGIEKKEECVVGVCDVRGEGLPVGS